MFTLVNRSEFIRKGCEAINVTLGKKPPPYTAVASFAAKELIPTRFSSPSDNFLTFVNFPSRIPDYELSYFQRTLFKAGIEIFAPVVMNGASSSDQLKIYKDHDIEQIDCNFLMGETGRRVGKTEIVTLKAAALLASTPNITIGFFSLFIPTCQISCDKVYDWLLLSGMTEEEIIVKTSLRIVVKIQNSKREINFFTVQNANVNDMFFIFFCFIKSRNLFSYHHLLPPAPSHDGATY